MKFECYECLGQKDFDTEYGILVIEKNKVLKRFCKECRNPKTYVPDVFWDGKPEENLANDPRTNKPIEFLSKGQKARYLKERGLMEAGDKYHGAPVSFSQNQNRQVVNSKEEVFKALKKVKEMGRDARRREYLKIIKHAERVKEDQYAKR